MFHSLCLNKSALKWNEILEPLEEEYKDFNKTLSHAIIDIQTATLRKSLSS